jgi:DNA-binding MarR family transcriptional regulator
VKPRKRDDPQRVLDAFRRLVKALRLADRAGLKRHGLGSAQTFVLHELNREAPLSINELAARTATHQSTVSVVVNKLVAKGYVENSRSDDDGRRAELVLTAKGKELVRTLPSPIQHVLITGVQRLPTKQAAELADMLEQIVGELGETDQHPPMFFDDAPPRGR